MADREARFAGEDQVTFTELRKQREEERARLIRDGIIDDPDKPVTLEHAKVLVGTCMDMCPRFEREERQFQNAVDKVEKDPITGRIDPRLAVKAYHRPAAGVPNPMPSDVRPPKVLVKTLDYLFHDLLTKYPFVEVHPFIRDRTRSVRADFRVQNSDGPECIESHERIIRFHILAIHLLTAESGFSAQQEMQQLRASMAALMDMYRSSRQRGIVPEHEAEFVAYRAFAFPDEPQEYMWLDDRTPSIVKTSSRMLGMVRTGDAKIFTIISQRRIPYLLACMLEPLFWDLRQRQLVGLNNKTFSRKVKFLTLEYVAEVLCLNSAEEARRFIEFYGLEVVENPAGGRYIAPKLRIDTSKPRQTLTIESSNLVESLRPPTGLPQIIDSGINAGSSSSASSIPKPTFNPLAKPFNPLAKPFNPPTAPAGFGRPTPSFPQPLANPAGPPATGFGKPVQTAPAFGAPNAFAPPKGPSSDRSAPAFGKPVGQPTNAFAPQQPGGPSRPAFGQPTSAFGKPTGTNALANAAPLSDDPPRPAFGQPTGSAFPSSFPSAASAPKPAFGAPTPAFGQPVGGQAPPPPLQPTQPAPAFGKAFPQSGPPKSVFDQPEAKSSVPNLFPSFPPAAPSIPPPQPSTFPSSAPKPTPSVFDKPAPSVFDQPAPTFNKPLSGFPSFPPAPAPPVNSEEPSLFKRIEFPSKPSESSTSNALTKFESLDSEPAPPPREPTPPPPPPPPPILEVPIRDITPLYEDLPQIAEVYFGRSARSTYPPPDLISSVTSSCFDLRPSDDITYDETALAVALQVAPMHHNRLIVSRIFATLKAGLLERQRRERLRPKKISATKKYWRPEDTPREMLPSPSPSPEPEPQVPVLEVLDIPRAIESPSSSDGHPRKRHRGLSEGEESWEYAHSSQSMTPEPGMSRSSVRSTSASARSSVLGTGVKRINGGGVKSREWRAMRYGVIPGRQKKEEEGESKRPTSLTASLMERIIKGKA